MADISVIQTPDGTSYNIKDATARTVMTGATSETSGASGLVPAPTTSDVSKFLKGDGTWGDGGKPMVVLSYGTSTWQDFINAYNNNVIVYCKASSNTNPATGAQTRMAFMAYVNADPPTSVEFQYYRSVSSHSASQQGDQVFVYKLESTNGGTWSVTTREASSKVVAGTNLTSSYSNGVITVSGDYQTFTGATSSSDGSTGLVPAPSSGDEEKYLRGDGTWHTVSGGGGTGDGDVTGPDSSTDGNVVLFDGATGKIIKDSGKTLGVSVPADAVFTDTTYESKTAASGGMDVSLVTTGEKYTWNNKSNLAIGNTATTAAAGNHTHTLSMATDSGTNAITLAASTKYKLTAGGSTYIFTTPSDTTYSNFVKSGSTAAAGLVPKPSTTAGTTKFLCENATWAVPPNDNDNTWRPVALDGTTKLSEGGGTTLNLVPGTNMSITYATGGAFTFTPDLSGCATSDHSHNTLVMNRTSTGNWLNLQCDSTQVGRLYVGTKGTASAEGWVYLFLGNDKNSTTAANATGQLRLYNKNGGYARLNGAYGSLGGTNRDYINCPDYFNAVQVWGAVWNDYAEMRQCQTVEAGRCVTETISGTMELTEGRLQAGCKIVSDTYGFCIGETKDAKTPIAVCGRVLAYPFKDPNSYHLGDAVCSAPGGTIDVMTREEIREYPERIVGTISEIPKYETWSAGSDDNPTEIPVNGRIWIYVR